MLGELAQAAAEGRSDVGLAEVGLLLAARFVGPGLGPRAAARGSPRPATGGARCEAALWLDAHAPERDRARGGGPPGGAERRFISCACSPGSSA